MNDGQDSKEPVTSSSEGKSYKVVWVTIGVLLIGLLLGYVVWGRSATDAGITESPEVGACTLDVKTCSNGAVVSRIPPSCEFADCPADLPVGDKPGLGACTRDIRECPDGTFVGRVAPDCEFQACPGN